MFEKDEDYRKARKESKDEITKVITFWSAREETLHDEGFQNGAEFGYNKAKEDVEHDLMMKLKDEGIVKPLKDSILQNERLSSQEQQELCAWIECAIEFGENLDECAKELEEVNKVNEWHYTKNGEYPKEKQLVEIYRVNPLGSNIAITTWYNSFKYTKVIAWKEIVLPELKESE